MTTDKTRHNRETGPTGKHSRRPARTNANSTLKIKIQVKTNKNISVKLKTKG